MYAMSVRVLPVPGGPCQTASEELSALFTATRWLGFNGSRTSFNAIASCGFCALPAQCGGVAANSSSVPFSSGTPSKARCKVAYAVEELFLSLARVDMEDAPDMPPGSENATSAASERSWATVFALKSTLHLEPSDTSRERSSS